MAGLQLSCVTEFPALPPQWKNVDVLALAHIKAPSLDPAAAPHRRPLRISAALDVSGSMRGQKLLLARESIAFMIQELSDEDEFGVIAFDTTVAVALPLTMMTDIGKAFAIEKVSALVDRCCTNLSGGLFVAVNQLHRMELPEGTEVAQAMPVHQTAGPTTDSNCTVSTDDPDGGDDGAFGCVGPEMSRAVDPEGDYEKEASSESQTDLSAQGKQHVTTVAQSKSSVDLPRMPALVALLFTDGLANEGVIDPARIVEMLRERLRAHHNDFVVNTFGFGSDHDADLLRRIAESTQGSYSYIQNENFMKESFANCLGGLLSIAASDVHLALSPAPSVGIAKLWTIYPVEDTEKGGKTIFIKDMFSEEERDILLTLRIGDVHSIYPGTIPSPSLLLVDVTLTFVNALRSNAEETVNSSVKICIGTDLSPCAGSPHPLVDEQRNRLVALEAMEAARLQAVDGNLAEARLRLESVQKDIVASASSFTVLNQCLVQQLIEAEDLMATTEEWSAVGSKKLAKVYNLHAQQRCNDVGKDVIYQNESSKQMRAKARKSS